MSINSTILYSEGIWPQHVNLCIRSSSLMTIYGLKYDLSKNNLKLNEIAFIAHNNKEIDQCGMFTCDCMICTCQSRNALTIKRYCLNKTMQINSEARIYAYKILAFFHKYCKGETCRIFHLKIAEHALKYIFSCNQTEQHKKSLRDASMWLIEGFPYAQGQVF